MLIYDRTKKDVQMAQIYRNAILSGEGLSDEEMAQWLVGMKGALNASDFIRVEQEMAQMKSALTALEISCEYVAQTWTVGEILSKTKVDRYLQNISNFRNTVWIPADTPSTPSNLFTWENANAAEKILAEVQAGIGNTLSAITYSGEAYAGD